MNTGLSFTYARDHLREVLDKAASGEAVRVQRAGDRLAVTDAVRLRAYFASTTSSRLRLGYEEGAWVASLDSRPFVSEGATPDQAIDDLVVSLREYADDWHDHLALASNHADAWGLVQLIGLSDDDELRAWLRAEPAVVDSDATASLA